MRRSGSGGISNVVLAVALVAGSGISALDQHAPIGRWTGEYVGAEKPAAVPAWRDGYAARFPDCMESLPGGAIPSAVVAVTLSGDVERVRFDRAWTRTHNAAEYDDLWVVGACK